MIITDEVVAAATVAVMLRDTEHIYGVDGWESIARAALEAAAPTLMAQMGRIAVSAWDEGADYMAGDWTAPDAVRRANPYREPRNA